MAHKLSITAIVIAACLSGLAAADSHISLYEHNGGQGHRVYLRSNGDCVGVPHDFNDRASSVDTHNTCMTVYEDGGCQGRSIDLRPGSYNHGNLGEHDFNDKISSVRAC